MTAPILIFPDFTIEFEIYCDASKFAIGAVLTQRFELIHPVSYASRQLNKHEINWKTSEKEMLTIIWASRYFKTYIYGRHTVFHTDHEPLSKLQKSSEPDGRLYRLMSKLQGWDHKIVYVPGIMNTTADLLSRPPTAAIKTLDVKIEIDWEDEQDDDKEIAIVKANIRNSSKSVEYKELENHEIWSKNRDFFLISKNVLFLKNKDNVDLIVVPKNLRKRTVRVVICAKR